MRGTGYVGDSAIDDVAVATGAECQLALAKMVADMSSSGKLTLFLTDLCRSTDYSTSRLCNRIQSTLFETAFKEYRGAHSRFTVAGRAKDLKETGNKRKRNSKRYYVIF